MLARVADREQARREWNVARELLTYLAYGATWLAGAAGLVLAQASLQLGDITAARQVAREAESALARMKDSGVLGARLAEVLKALDEAAVPAGITAAPLTAAEIRVLRLPSDPPEPRRDRGQPLRLPQHGEDARDLGLPQARCVVTARRRRSSPRARAARLGTPVGG